MSNNNNLIAYGATKLMRLVIIYFSLLISKNFTTQIYMDKVLVNGENPPKLSNFIYLFMCIEVFCIAIFLALLYAVNDTFDLSVNISTLFQTLILPDMVMYYLFILVSGIIISQSMYSKKYFLYKDDGLRGIRALHDIVLKIAIFYSCIPLNFIVTGAIHMIKKL